MCLYHGMYVSVCIWHCEHARFCVEVFFMRYIQIFIHSFTHSYPKVWICANVMLAHSKHSDTLSGWRLSKSAIAAVFVLLFFAIIWCITPKRLRIHQQDCRIAFFPHGPDELTSIIKTESISYLIINSVWTIYPSFYIHIKNCIQEIVTLLNLTLFIL